MIFEERAAADDEAVRVYEAALALDAASRPVLAGLARALLPQRPARSAGAVLLRQAAGEPNPAGASAYAVEAARVFALRLGRIDEARRRRCGRWLRPANVAAVDEHARRLARTSAARSWPTRWGRWARRRRTRRTRRPRTGCKPRWSNGGWDRGARRWRRSSARLRRSRPGRGTSRYGGGGDRHRARAAVPARRTRRRGGPAQVGELGNGRWPTKSGGRST